MVRTCCGDPDVSGFCPSTGGTSLLRAFTLVGIAVLPELAVLWAQPPEGKGGLC